MQHRLETAEDCNRADAQQPEAEARTELDVGGSPPQLPGFATQLIGQRMRAMYDSIAREPVPEDLLELIRKLEAKEQSK